MILKPHLTSESSAQKLLHSCSRKQKIFQLTDPDLSVQCLATFVPRPHEKIGLK